MRGLIIGWIVLGILLEYFKKFSVPVFTFSTELLFETIRRCILATDMNLFVAIIGGSPQYVFEALMTMGIFITGAVNGSIVALLHRRKVSVNLLLAVAVLMLWIIQAIIKHPPSVGAPISYFSMCVGLAAGIVTGGLLWRKNAVTAA
jgi:hypothetical protein